MLHHLLLLHAHLLGIDLGEALDAEAPAVQTAAEGHVSDRRVHLQASHGRIAVSRNDDIHVLDGASESAVDLLNIHLHLQDTAVNLVDEKAWLHPFLQRLPENRLRLDSAALNAIHDHNRPVGDAQRRGHFRGEVHMTRGVNQIDEVWLGPCPVLTIVLEEEGDSGALDRHTALLLILPPLHELGITS